MAMIKLGYDKKEKFNWKNLGLDYGETHYNNYLVVKLHQRLWLKVKNIMISRSKGFDAVVLIDGVRRSGKSTLAKSIGYLLDPNMTINNYVSGMEEAADKIQDAKDESTLIFDEGSLVASSKDGMAKKNKQLMKIIDVVGQKRLCLIFCMPSFFEMTRSIAITHSTFLIHVVVREKDLARGFFWYFGTKKKKILYLIGKKNQHSYSKPKFDWDGKFEDFHIPFEKEYLKLKRESLAEALNLNKKGKVMTEDDYKTKFMVEFKENRPDIEDKTIWEGFGSSSSSFYRRKKKYIEDKGVVT